MRLLFVHNYYRSTSPSGEDTVAQNERLLLEKKGIEVFSYEKFNDDLDDTTLGRRIRLGLESAWSRQVYGELLDLVKRVRPDVAHFHSIHPQISPSAYFACQRMGVAVVHTLHNYRYICPGALLERNGRPCEDCVGHMPFKALIHRCYRNSLGPTGSLVWMIVYNRWRRTLTTMVDRFIALTEFAKSRFIAGGFSDNQIEIKPNFVPNPPNPSLADRVHGAFVGRISSEKGVKTLISAWRSVKGMPLKIIGDGPLRKELELQVRREGLNVEFMGKGNRADVFSILQGALFAIVPSECYEGFPMVALEAYACGTPVIASRLGSLSEIVLNGETGLLFEAGNPTSLVEKADLLFHNRDLAARMGRRALDVFDEKYTADTNFARLMAIYQKAIESKQKAGQLC